MRRIIHNSTAVAACLSLLAPHLAMAQPLTAGAAQDRAPSPLVLAQAQTEAEQADLPPLVPAEEAVEDEDDATDEAEDGPQDGGDLYQGMTDPEAEAPAESEPEAEPVEEPQPEPAPVEEPAEEPETPAEPEAMTEEDPVEEEAADEAAPEETPAEAPAAEAQAAEAQAAEAQTAPESSAAPRARPQREEGTRPGNRPERAAPAESNDDADDLAEALRAQEDAPAETTATEDQPTEATSADDAEDQPAEAAQADKADDSSIVDDLAEALRGQSGAAATAGALALAAGSVQAERSQSLPGLANVLSGEVDAGLTAESLTCLDGSAFPCADGGRAMTPSGVVVETNGAGELRLAPVEAQMYRVGQNGQMQLRAAEEDTPETEISREAAEAATPSSAAALEAEEGTGEVTEEQVTEENSRSSGEDFTTNLRDALAASGVQGQQSQDSGDNNNLRNALLLGLGALAVGSYLNNNRQVALSAPDRVVVTRPDGSQEVIRDDVALLRQPGSTVTTENFDDGSSRTIVTRADGSRIVTIRDANLQVLRRTLVSADGTTTRLIDDTVDVQPVNVAQLPPAATPVQTSTQPLNEEQLREALLRESSFDRRFTLSQIRNIPEVRALVAPVNIDAITFDTGSAAIRADQAQSLQSLGRTIQDAVAANPREIFLIEGHTDTVGSDAANLALSDRRAESVALALAEYFDVPPENMVTQGYGEQFLRIRAEGDIRENRRASVRRITDLLAQ
ncbi:OmpA family protein [Paracoccus aestuarii]|uniref:OmpA family protein n=1 Tax=Paracoccus aestuarii TaxID=453842 RepID=A0A419A1P7_9RHOB|nr:OmpA family protein [Paracoccus aestuarii]RJL06887.1 OmpA family protein [Paracoccus aestuarii]WCQ99789.1 OmpA family protein [Paracoccus aestuarii]